MVSMCFPLAPQMGSDPTRHIGSLGLSIPMGNFGLNLPGTFPLGNLKGDVLLCDISGAGGQVRRKWGRASIFQVGAGKVGC